MKTTNKPWFRNFWVALGMACVSFLLLIGDINQGKTVWICINSFSTIVWLFLAWATKMIERMPEQEGDNND